MVSTLTRGALQIACKSARATNFARHIHLNSPAQNSWLGRLFEKFSPAGNAKTPQSDVVKEDKLPRRTVQKAASEASNVPAPESVKATEQNTLMPTPVETKPRKKRTPLTSSNKQRRFSENMLFLGPRLGRRPEVRSPLIRKTVWIRTLALCEGEDQLRKVMELMPLWRDTGHQFDTTFSHAFIRRCLYLNKPEFALEVFGDYGKYNVPLTLPGARELLHGTYDSQPLSFVMTVTSLFNVYDLRPIAKDLPCCAMVIAACLKNDSKDAKVIAETLLPHMKTMVKNKGPQPSPKGQDIGKNLPLVWGIQALKKVDERLPKRDALKRERAWLHSWRLESGHVESAQRVG